MNIMFLNIRVNSRIYSLLFLLAISSTAVYSQNCNRLLQRAIELMSQEKYCEAKDYFERYARCDANADVSDEIAWCARRCMLPAGNQRNENRQTNPVNQPMVNNMVELSEVRNEFSINLGGGISGFWSRSPEFTNLVDWTATIGLGNHFFFAPRWGIGIGINFTLYNGNIFIDDGYYRVQSVINIATGNPFDVMLSSSDYRENYQIAMVTIPLMFKYRGSPFYFAFGGKLGVPVWAKSQTEGLFTTMGYFPHLNVTYENLPLQGFVNDKKIQDNELDFDMKAVVMASFEIGFRWRLGNKKASLYTGIYADIGVFNKQSEKHDKDLVTYQLSTPSQFEYNSALNSFAREISQFSSGLTLRFAFGR